VASQIGSELATSDYQRRSGKCHPSSSVRAANTLEKFRSFVDFLGAGDNKEFLAVWQQYCAEALIFLEN